VQPLPFRVRLNPNHAGRLENLSIATPLHKMTEAQAKREMAAVGLVWEKTLEVLPTQHLMVFRKP